MFEHVFDLDDDSDNFDELVRLAETGTHMAMLAFAHTDQCEDDAAFWQKIAEVAPSANDWLARMRHANFPEFISDYEAHVLAKCWVYHDGDQLAWCRMRQLLNAKRSVMQPEAWGILHEACTRNIDA